MSNLRSLMSVTRWAVAALVAYSFIHAGSHTMAQVAMGLHRADRTSSDLLQLMLVGAIEVAGAFGLFAVPVALRAVSAATLLGLLIVPVGVDVGPLVSGWCVAATALLLLLPAIPRFEEKLAGLKMSEFDVVDHSPVTFTH